MNVSFHLRTDMAISNNINDIVISHTPVIVGVSVGVSLSFVSFRAN